MAAARDPVQTPSTAAPSATRRASEDQLREPKAMNTTRTPPPGADMPYFREYLRTVLRPRVESLLQALNGRLDDVVWRELLEALSRDQGGAGAMDSDTLRGLLEEHLGLRLDAQVRGTFAEAALPEPPPAGTRPDDGANDASGARRRAVTVNPLANAVLDNRAPRF